MSLGARYQTQGATSRFAREMYTPRTKGPVRERRHAVPPQLPVVVEAAEDRPILPFVIAMGVL
jgi:hypothetical protein